MILISVSSSMGLKPSSVSCQDTGLPHIVGESTSLAPLWLLSDHSNTSGAHMKWHLRQYPSLSLCHKDHTCSSDLDRKTLDLREKSKQTGRSETVRMKVQTKRKDRLISIRGNCALYVSPAASSTGLHSDASTSTVSDPTDIGNDQSMQQLVFLSDYNNAMFFLPAFDSIQFKASPGPDRVRYRYRYR